MEDRAHKRAKDVLLKGLTETTDLNNMYNAIVNRMSHLNQTIIDRIFDDHEAKRNRMHDLRDLFLREKMRMIKHYQEKIKKAKKATKKGIDKQIKILQMLPKQ